MFEALALKGTKLLRGQLCLVCAGPGTGKSAFVLTYVLKAKLPTLYLSADSDAFTQLTRSISILTGWSMDKSAEAVRNGDLGEVEAELADVPIRFNYNASPSQEQIETTMLAYDEVMGDFPAVVVIDNITNVRSDTGDGDPFSGLEALMDYFHDMARGSAACVIGLHHVQGEYNNGDKPIPLGGVKGQITRVPEMVLTLHRIKEEFGSDELRVSTVKNRYGRSDASGMDYACLEFIGDAMTIRDFPTT